MNQIRFKPSSVAAGMLAAAGAIAGVGAGAQTLTKQYGDFSFKIRQESQREREAFLEKLRLMETQHRVTITRYSGGIRLVNRSPLNQRQARKAARRRHAAGVRQAFA